MEISGKISEKEKDLFQWWMEDLREPDRENARIFIEKTQRFFREYQESQRDAFFLLNAVGSTVYRKPNYDDIDFLLVTNSDLPGFEGAMNRNYSNILLPEYYVTTAETHLEHYHDNPASLPGRDVQNITPQDGIDSPWKKIHHILQRNVKSESEWEKREVYLKLPIFRLPALG